ncbi:MAG: hypothetical protein HYX91_04105 [Chloroflexi bacterium]|nr:hypothetical protein [Chloroflexota bacterium]
MDIVIVDNSAEGKCDARCGVDWSEDSTRSLAEERIRAQLGADSRFSYLDLASTEACASNPEIMARARALPLPVLFIDGEPRISGFFDHRMLTDAIDATMELLR